MTSVLKNVFGPVSKDYIWSVPKLTETNVAGRYINVTTVIILMAIASLWAMVPILMVRLVNSSIFPVAWV
jgi:hypothetical protein